MSRTKIIGLTGGIGSGKSTVAKVFATLGVPVFDADSVAKSIYDEDPELIQQMQTIWGEAIFSNHSLDKTKLAQLVFSDENELARLNALVHPRVKQKFHLWLQQQDARYVIREAAILIESGSHEDCDEIILVSAPEELRTLRVIKRSGLSEPEVKSRIKRQWTDEQRRPYCQHEIVNDEKELITPKIVALHEHFKA